jgi:hypothetical protein
MTSGRNMQAACREARAILAIKTLENIAKNPVLSESIIIQGGSAMRFGYSSPRFTNDIDFVTSQKLDKTGRDWVIGQLRDAAPSMVENIPVQVRVKEVSEEMFRITFSMELDRGSVAAIKLEGYCSAPPATPSVKYQTQYGGVNVESPTEIIVDKIAANLDRIEKRGGIKSGDVFDIFFLTNAYTYKVTKQMVMEKARCYGTELSSKDLKMRLGRILTYLNENNEKIVKDILNSLEPHYREHFNTERMMQRTKKLLACLQGERD